MSSEAEVLTFEYMGWLILSDEKILKSLKSYQISVKKTVKIYWPEKLPVMFDITLLGF